MKAMKPIMFGCFAALVLAIGLPSRASAQDWLTDPSVFNCADYLNEYIDLREVFGADIASPNCGGAQQHWVVFGSGGEQRRSSLVFDCVFYRQHNPDLGGLSCAGAAYHWFYNGRHEGRQASADFDVREYLLRYSDLMVAFCPGGLVTCTNFEGAINHFITLGRVKEGRSGAPAVAGRIPLNLHATAFRNAPGTSLPPKINRFPFRLPSGTSPWVGFSGFIKFKSDATTFSQMLVSVATTDLLPPLPGDIYPRCPDPSQTTDFSGLKDLHAFIVKLPANGEVQLPINFVLPVGVPISDCVVISLDGTATAGGKVWMQSQLELEYAETGTASAYVVPLGREVCFGPDFASTDCFTYIDRSNALQFAGFYQQKNQPSHVIAVSGSISDSTLDYPLPSGTWTMTNKFYKIPAASCGQFQTASPGIFTIPPDATEILSVPLSPPLPTPSGRGVLQSAVYQPVSGVDLQVNDCLVSLVYRTGDGNIDAEAQVRAVVQPFQ